MNYKMIEMRSWYLVLLLLTLNVGVFAQSFTERFDASSLSTPKPWLIEGWNKNSSTILSTERKLSGTKAFKAYLPAQVYSNPRSEIKFEGGVNGFGKYQPIRTTWGTGFAVYVPSDFKPDNTSQEIIFQYHRLHGGVNSYKNPPFSILLNGNNLYVAIRHFPEGVPSTKNNMRTTKLDIGTFTPGQWHYFVIDMHWDYRTNGNGFAKIYMRKGSKPSKSNLVVNYKGPISSNDEYGPYLKLGIYKWDWANSTRVNQSKSSGVRERLLYFDDVTIQKGGILEGASSTPNQAPSVNITGTKNITLPTNSTTLTANASDSDGSISSYSWSKVSGPGASLSGTSSRSLNISNMSAGTYSFRVTVKDNDGATASSNVSVVVNSSTSNGGGTTSGSSVVSAGSDFSVPVADGSFVLTPKFPTGIKPEDLRWKKISGPSATMKYIGYPYSVSDIKVGTYVFEVWVKYDGGKEATDRITVTVTNGGASGSTDENTSGSSVVDAGDNFSVPVADGSFVLTPKFPTGIKPEDLRWKKISGPTATMKYIGYPYSVSDIKVGTYVFEVWVKYDGGKEATDRITVTVTNGGASGSTDENTSGSSVVDAGDNFSVPVADGSFVLTPKFPTGIKPEDLRWKKISGPSATMKYIGYPYSVSDIKVGTYVFEVWVKYDGGKEATDRITVTVTNGGASGSTDENTSGSSVVDAGDNFSVPVADGSFVLTPKFPTGIKPEDLRWKKISGPSATMRYIGYPYEVRNFQVGTYVFEVWITYDNGKEATDRITVTVTGATSMASNVDHPGVEVRNFSTKSESVKILSEMKEGLKVHLKNVNGVKLSIENFDGELNTEVIRHGMYQYDVVDDEGEIVQKGTLLIY